SPQNRLIDIGAKFGDLPGADQWTEIERWRSVGAGWSRNWMAESQRLHNLQIGIKKARKELPLYNEPHIGGTSLFTVFKALLDLLFEFRPIGKFPHSVGIDALHFQHVGDSPHLHPIGDNVTGLLASDE